MAKGKYEYWLTPEGLLKIEGWARDGLTDEEIAGKLDIVPSTLYEWKKKYSEISESLKKGKEVIDRQVESALLKRALGYSYDEVTYERLVDTGQKKRHNGIQELTEKEWNFAKSYFNGKCCYCGAETEMTKDHIVPLNNGGEMTFDNIIPCCQHCNSAKQDKDIWEWYRAQLYYSEEREKHIMEYLSLIPKIREFTDNVDATPVVTRKVTKEVLPDTTAQIFWLKNRKPEMWRDKQQIEHTGLEEQQAKFAELLEQRRKRREGK